MPPRGGQQKTRCRQTTGSGFGPRSTTRSRDTSRVSKYCVTACAYGRLPVGNGHAAAGFNAVLTVAAGAGAAGVVTVVAGATAVVFFAAAAFLAGAFLATGAGAAAGAGAGAAAGAAATAAFFAA